MYYLNFHREKNIFIDIIAKDLVDKKDAANSRSLVMKLVNKQGKETSMLFLGDLENEKSNTFVYDSLMLLGGTVLKSDVIMLPHHGSSTNGNGENVDFYELVDAKYGIISSHIASTHQHPRIKALNSFCGREVEACTIGKVINPPQVL